MSDPSASPSPCLNHLDGLTGSQTRQLTSKLLFGTNASWMLLGFLVVQTYTYYTVSEKDSRKLKAFVYGLIILHLFETAADSFVTYVFDAKGWGQPSIIHNFPAAVLTNLQNIIVGITGISVHTYLAWRIFLFTNTFGKDRQIVAVKFVTISILLLALANFGANLAITGQMYKFVTDEPVWFHRLTIAWMAFTTATNIIITICMTIMLNHSKAAAYFGDDKDLLSIVVRSTIQTGLLLALTSIAGLVLISLNLVQIYSLPQYILGKMYVITLLTNLNNREEAVDEHSSEKKQSGPKVSTIHFAAAQRRTQDPGRTSNGITTFFRSLGSRGGAGGGISFMSRVTGGTGTVADGTRNSRHVRSEGLNDPAQIQSDSTGLTESTASAEPKV